MSLSLYMDQHVKSAVTAGLRIRGLSVVTAQDDGTSEREDADILKRATELGRILFTQDEDFLSIAQDWQEQSRPFCGVIYGHQLTLTIGAAVNDLNLICQVLAPEEVRNTMIFLPL